MLSGSYERQNRLNNHCCNERQQPITEITALSNLECQQQSADINNPPVFVHSSGKQPPQPAINTRCSSPDQTAVTMTYGNANYEYTTTTRSTSDLFTFSSIADYGLTSPDAKSSLCFDNDVCQQSTAIKTPLSRINHVHSDLRVSKPSDTPYQRRHRLLERAALPILADNILDMRLCSSPAPLEVSLNSSGEIHRLPSQHSPKDTIRRITPQTMVNVLDGVYQSCYNQLLIIDCRYPYEYLGGHIPGAININTPDAIDRLLLENPDKSSHTCIVFHCEFSSQRAPRMALHVRNFDRLLNSDRYPHLHYPEIYILDGGYKAFYDSFSERCDPPHQYVPMKNPNNRDDLRHHQKLRQTFRSHWAHSHISKRPAKTFTRSQSMITIDPARSFFKQLSESNLLVNNDQSVNNEKCMKEQLFALDSVNEFDICSQDIHDLPSSIY